MKQYRTRWTRHSRTERPKNLLEVPDNMVRSCGETVSPEFRLGFLVDRLQDNPTMINVIASELRLDFTACVRSGMAELAVDAAESVQAANSLEKMLCHQMAAAHCAAMKLTASSLDALLPVEMARLSNAAARMMQVFQEGLLTLPKDPDRRETDGCGSACSGIRGRTGGDSGKNSISEGG